MAGIIPFLEDEVVFNPGHIEAMSMALDDVCKSLRLDGDGWARETVAVRIIELARRAEHSPTKLRDRVLAEAKRER
jgi:hypothetical protein